jgi:hypothetical protein
MTATINVTPNDVLLLIEALTMAAGRHESQSRFNPPASAPHDRKAQAMRKLKTKLMKMKDEPQ